MANSPILQIPQVAPSQSAKETTINDGVSILERSLNDIKSVDLSAGNAELNLSDYTRAMLFKMTGHTVARDLEVPVSKRFFAVKNDGTGVVTVKPTSGAGTSADIPVGSFVVLFNDGVNVLKLSDSQAALGTTFLAMTDTPTDYTGDEGKIVKVKADGTGLEFVNESTAITTFVGLSDTPGSLTGQGLKGVRVNTGGTALEFYTIPDPGAVTLEELDDGPGNYAGGALKFLAVKATEDGFEFVDAPEPIVRETRDAGLINKDFSLGLAGWDLIEGNWQTTTDGAGFLAQDGTSSYLWTGTISNTDAILSQVVDLTAVATTLELDDNAQIVVPFYSRGVDSDTGLVKVDFLDGSDAVLDTITSPTLNDLSGWIARSVSGTLPTGTRKIKLYAIATAVDEVNTDYALSAFDMLLKVSVGQIANFTDLNDAPSSYTGHGSKLVRVNTGATGLEFIDAASVGRTTFLSLDDTADYSAHAGKAVVVNNEGDGLEYLDFPESGGAESFTQLDDTPADYTGAALKLVRVNAGGNGLEFVTAPAGTFAALTDAFDPAGDGGRYVKVKDDASGLEPGYRLVVLDQATYDGLTPDANTLYFITE